MKPLFALFTPKTALLGLLLLSASCTKNGDAIMPNEPALPCAGRNLRLTALTINPVTDVDGDGKVDEDLLTFLPACARDNTINFEKNGTLSGNEGFSKCPVSDDGDDVGTLKPGVWTYNQQTKKIHIVYNGKADESVDWEVVNVSASVLRAKVRAAADEANTPELIMTWQAQ